MNKQLELAKQIIAYSEERITAHEAEDYDEAFEIECNQRDIAEELSLLLLSEQDNTRFCDNCNEPVDEGYCCGDGEQYFCSDDCLYADGYTPEQKEIDYKDGSIYWTTWEEN